MPREKEIVRITILIFIQEEVKAEAERLQNENAAPPPQGTQSQTDGSAEPLQDRIDRLRAQVADLDNRLEEHT